MRGSFQKQREVLKNETKLLLFFRILFINIVAIEKGTFSSPSTKVSQLEYIYIYIYIYIYTNFVECNRHFLSTYFLVDPFIFIYRTILKVNATHCNGPDVLLLTNW